MHSFDEAVALQPQGDPAQVVAAGTLSWVFGKGATLGVGGAGGGSTGGAGAATGAAACGRVRPSSASFASISASVIIILDQSCRHSGNLVIIEPCQQPRQGAVPVVNPGMGMARFMRAGNQRCQQRLTA